MQNKHPEDRDHNDTTNSQRKQIKSAAALKYDENDFAPRVIAGGNGIFADKIIKIAEESGVPIHHDKELSKLLSILEVNSYIPVEVYGLIAEILIYLKNKDKVHRK